MPHFATDDVADDCGHFRNAEEFRPGRPVALARVACRIEERGYRNAGDIVDRGRGVAALSIDWQRKDPEMRRERQHLHIGAVSKEAGSDGGVRDARKRGEHPIDKPKLARQKRRVVGPGEPLRKPDDLFQAGLTRSYRKRRPALDDEGMIGRTVVRSLHPAQRVHLLAKGYPVRATVRLQDVRSNLLQQLGDYGATGSSSCAGDQNFWIDHGLKLLLAIQYRTNDKEMVRLRTGVKRK